MRHEPDVLLDAVSPDLVCLRDLKGGVEHQKDGRLVARAPKRAEPRPDSRRLPPGLAGLDYGDVLLVGVALSGFGVGLAFAVGAWRQPTPLLVERWLLWRRLWEFLPRRRVLWVRGRVWGSRVPRVGGRV
jgi:hypothetical protein